MSLSPLSYALLASSFAASRHPAKLVTNVSVDRRHVLGLRNTPVRSGGGPGSGWSVRRPAIPVITCLSPRAVNAGAWGLSRPSLPSTVYPTHKTCFPMAPFAYRGCGSSGTRGHTLIRKRNLLLGDTCGSKPWGLSRCGERRWENSTASARPGPIPSGRLSGGSLPPTSSRRPLCSFPLTFCPRARPPARTSWPRTWGRR